MKIFFRGANVLDFSRLWEKVYQYALVVQKTEFIKYFFKYINSELDKIAFHKNLKKSEETKEIKLLTNKIKSDLLKYNQLSFSLCLGLLDLSDKKKAIENEFFQSEKNNSLFSELVTFELWHQAKAFRCSNLIRHQLVAWPLANFTNYEGNLTDEKSFLNSKMIQLDNLKLELSPRFIHFDEWQLFELHGAISASESNVNDTFPNWIEQSLDKYKSQYNWDDIQIQINNDKEQTCSHETSTKSLIVGDNNTPKKSLRVALANFRVNSNDIEYSVRKDKRPNVSFERQTRIYQILNEAKRNKTELLVMPEVSVPVSWLPFMVSFSRRNQIAIVFGLEHWVVDDHAYNLLIEALPFKAAGKYNSTVVTARLKNHYAPGELEMLESVRLKPASNLIKKDNYHKVSWNNVTFATYNCFELSDIRHRSIFKSEIDMLIACV
ncbi:hypothetical protein [Photobacterium kasasachensis]|uniref:hypothetical protein n=1 Tax=Photobacterium kasasachensis TaxID=2910240 RepID=UPI003D12F2FC